MRDVDDIDVVLQRDNLSVNIIEKGTQKVMDLSDVSEGTLKALVWNLLLKAPQKVHYDLLAIDEPENNMHPAWQAVLSDVVQHSSSYNQCIISTHSPDFHDGFTESFKSGMDVSVFVFGLNGRIRKVEYSEISEVLGNCTLGDLYRCNDQALGGWPW